MTKVFKEERRTQKDRERSHVMMEPEIRAMGQECQEHQELQRARERHQQILSYHSRRDGGPADTLNLDFLPPTM
jgi:hypothetical protein